MATMRGGENFSKKLAEIAEAVGDGGKVAVGWLEKAKYPDGTSVALVAAIDEFGAPSRGQPPRPAFRNMIAAKEGEWPAATAGLLKANNYDTEKTLTLLGHAVAGQLRESVATITDPPLKPSTIARKGFAKPWIETSHLINSIDFEVKK